MKIRTLLWAAGIAGLTSLVSPAATVETPGFLKYDCWFPPLRDPSLTGVNIFDLVVDPNYQANRPDMTTFTSGLTTRPVFPDDTHDQYGARLTGWVTPVVTDDYYFYLRSDDASELSVSSDSTEAGLQVVAQETGCCNPFQDPGHMQTSQAQHLLAGQKYYLQVLLKEGEGGDYVEVAMQSTNGTTPAASLLALRSTMLSCMADPAGASLAISKQPANITTPENATSVSFSIEVTAVTPNLQYTGGSNPTNGLGLAVALGTSKPLDPFFQWFTNGVEVPGANGTNYTIAWPKKVQDGMKVKCYVAVPGIPLYSSEATLTVTADTTPPTVVSAKADASFADVIVKFSEPVSDTALQAGNYTLDQGATVTSVDRLDATTVKLNTALAQGKTYTLTINGVQDMATPANSIAANTTIQFKSFVFVPGVVLHEKYTGFIDDDAWVAGVPGNLFSDPRYSSNPDRKELVTRFEYPAGGIGRDPNLDPPGTENRDYFDTMEGYFMPPTNGDYVFFMAFADNCWMYLSTDESAANKHLIAHAEGWSDPRNWLKSYDYNVADARSDQYSSTEWPGGVGAPITLQANKKYYMLMVHFDPSWAGGDWFAATMKGANDNDPANGSAPTLTDGMIGCYLDPTIGSVTFSLQPTNITVLAGNRVTLYARASGTSDYTTNVLYQWQSAPKGSSTFTDIAGATGASYTTPYLVGADDGKQFRVVAMVAPVSAISSVATLTVNVDTVPPTVVRASTDMSLTSVLLVFSEPVTDTALSTSRYQMDKGISVTGVARVDGLTVKLTTSPMALSQTYILTINGVQDTAIPPNTIAANTQVEVRTLLFVTGAVLHQKYTNVDNGTGSSPDGLFTDARFPNSPSRRDMEQRWEYPADGLYRDQTTEPDGAAYRNYFDTIEGYFIPPATTNYVFFICGADRFWLYLSTDESPANKHLIAAQPDGWTAERGWMTGQGGTDVTGQRSDKFSPTEWPNVGTDGMAVISLQAGQRYYLLEVHHDPSWCGADDFAATYTVQGQPDPQDGDAPALAGSVIGYYFDPSGATVSFTKQPQSVTATPGQTATFTVAATGSSAYGNTVLYQWQSAPSGSSSFTDIPGATGARYQTPFLALADNGTQFRVIASVPPYSLASSVATLTVVADTFPPVVSVGAMLDDTAGIVDVGVDFDETVDDSVGQMANYSVSPGTITSISLFTNRFTANSQNPFATILKQSVLLKVTGLTGSGTLTVRNLGDLHDNRITAVTVPFTVDTRMKWGVVGANEFGGWNAVTPVAPGGWDMYSDGVGAWARYDEATLVYEQVTGDFDKKLRVVYQDGSSEWARAGLIVKEQTAFGVDRATQATTATRYQKCLVSPVGATLTGPGTNGYALWSLNRRLDTGGPSDGGNITGLNAQPAYPDAWCRIKRVDQTFTMYRSDDGVNWVTLGTTTWGVDDVSKTPMPLTLYVGPDFAPEIGNVTLPADQGTFLAQIREYGDYSTTFNPGLKIALDTTGKVTITWTTGTLVSSPTPTGNYAPVSGATSPWSVTPSGTMFYRVQQ